MTTGAAGDLGGGLGGGVGGAVGGEAVPFRVPARFLFVGAAALAAFWTILAFAPHWALAHAQRPGVLALVHVMTLLFGSSVLVGALHQLVPVMLTTRLRAPGLGGATWVAITAGGAGVVIAFALGSRPAWLAAGGTTALVGATLLLANLASTARSARRIDLPAAAVLASAAALWATFAMGLLIALSRVVPALAPWLGGAKPFHVTLGFMAVFVLAIAGAGHRLLSMFVLTHGAPTRALAGVLASTGAALAAAAVVAWGPPAAAGPARAALAATIVATAVLAALDARSVLARRLRRRPDVFVTTFLVGVATFVPAAGLAAVGRFEEAAILALLGGVTPAIAGMLVKIASFLTWTHRYAGTVGRTVGRGSGATPMLADMTVPALGRATGVGLTVAAACVVAARLAEGGPTIQPAAWTLGLVRAGAVAGAVGAWSLFAHLTWIVAGRHQPSVRAEPAVAA